jgi:ATP-dependent helicase IRC3
MQERKYQLECEDAIVSNFDKNVRRQLVNMATGTGKTVVFSKLYERLKSRLPGQQIVLAHREELIGQALKKLREVNPALNIQEERAEIKADPASADIIVASVATIGRKGTKRVQNYNWERIDKLIVDEAHHASADSYRNVFDLFRSDRPSLLLGVTATPQRSDGKALAAIFDKIVYVYSIRQAIEDGWLVDVRGFKVQTGTDLGGIRKTAGDFAQEELAAAINTAQRNRLVVEQWDRLGQKRQTVAFCVDIQHAKDLAREFEGTGVVAAAVWGNDPDRAEKLRLHRSGNIRVLCNCGVLTEGYDDWQIGCIILARPTMSGVLFTQMVGRGTRLQEGTGNLKEWCSMRDLHSTDGCTVKKDLIVIDMVDSTGKHSLVTLPTLMGLQAGLNLKGGSLVGAVQALEDAQKDHPNVDFYNLNDIEGIKALIESVNMMEVRFPEEVEENSDLMWFKAAGGGYRMNIPKTTPVAKTGYVKIYQNLLDKWEIDGDIGGNLFHGVRESIEDAFRTADEQVRQRGKNVLNLLKRKASWHDGAATIAQFKLLKKFYPYKTFPDTLSKGQASKLISERLAGKATK